MDCVSCGLTIDPDEPTWSVYAWDAFEFKILEAMAMHEACYTAGEFIQVSEWQNDPNDQPILVDLGQQRRLMRAPSSGMFIWSINPETSEGFLAPYFYSRAVKDAMTSG